MMGALRGKKPDVKEKRLKMFVYGPAGVGKTTGVIQFPKAYLIDTEKGMENYADTIAKSGSVVFQSLNPDEIKEEVHVLLTENHDYRTLVIDPITQVYNSTQEKWNRIFEKYAKNDKEGEVQDFGMRYWGKVKGDFKGLQRLMLSLDMNVIITSHQKDVYGAGFSKIGVTFDSMRGDDYFFDLVFQVERKGDKLIAKTIKERAEVGKQKFPAEFEWSYDNFCKFYGKEIIEKQSEPVAMATLEQVERAKKLVETVKVEEAEITKWFTKADVDTWAEMKAETIQKCIDYLQAKVKEVSEPPPVKVAGQPVTDFSQLTGPEAERKELLAKCEKAKETLGVEIFNTILKTFKEDTLDRLDNGELTSLIAKCNTEYRAREFGKKKKEGKK